MKRFKNILVGIDLAQGDVPVSGNLAPPTEEAVSRASWLAKCNSARLTFLHVLPRWALDCGAETPTVLEGCDGKRTAMEHAKEIVAEIAGNARNEGIVAQGLVVAGKSWVELIRQVLREDHDLVITGTRHRSLVQSVLMGSTGMKMLRKCPCPVWVTRPQSDSRIATVLVAHDLTPVGELALELGSSMARLQDAQLHVLHSVKYLEFDSMFPARVPHENAAKYRAESKRQIEEQLANAWLPRPALVHIVNEAAHCAILDHIVRYDVQLLVMGTVARTGIPGMITGNTAERLLPQIPCSVLAVKPTGFKSPIMLNKHKDEDT